mgnify:CR=1 FL=1
MLVNVLASLFFATSALAAEGDAPAETPPDAPAEESADAPAEDAPAEDAPAEDAPAEDTGAADDEEEGQEKAEKKPLLGERQAPGGARVVLRGVGEMWHDTAIATRFKGGGIVAGLGGVVPLNGLLALDAEIAYSRTTGEGEGTLQIAPMSLLVEARFLPAAGDGLEMFAGLGPAMVVWSESGQDPTATAPEGLTEGPTVLRGARPGLEVRMGARIDLGLVQPSLMTGQQDPVKAVELEILGARRFATTGSGFNWNTWRLGAGLAVRF